MTRYFLDTEFNEEVDPVELISIGMVTENGREFYAVNETYLPRAKGPKTCNTWVQQNVLPNLFAQFLTNPEPFKPGYPAPAMPLTQIRDGLIEFVGNDPFPEFWAYYGDYDWYLVCRLFGRFDQQPKTWKKAGNICFDVRQFAKHVGVEKTLPKKFEPEHNALIDARWTKQAFDMVRMERDRTITSAAAKEAWP